MGGEQIVAEIFDVVERKLRRSMRIEIRRHVDEFLFALFRRLYRHILHVDVRSVEGRALFGQFADKTRIHAVAVYQTGYFHAGVFGQIGDQPRVQHVSVDSVCGIVDIRVDDRHAEFVANLVFHGMRGNFFAQLLPTRDLVDTAPRIFVEGILKRSINSG